MGQERRVREWAKTSIPDACLNNNRGRAPGDMAWRYMVRSDIHVDHGGCCAELMWDISKAFDRVPRDVLVQRALALGYPSTILRLSMNSYAWPRRLVDGALIAAPITPVMGIGPGSAFATFELAALVISDLRAMQLTHPYADMHWRMCAGVESAQCLLSVLQSCCTACGTEVVRLARRHGGL